MKRKKNLLQNGEGNNLNQWNILLWNTSIQRAPPFRGHKIESRKNVNIIFVSFTSVVGTSRRKGHFFWVTKPGFTFHSGNTLEINE